MIRSFRLQDIPLVARLQRDAVPLNLESRYTRSTSLLGSAILSRILSGRNGVCTFVADHQEDSGRWRGLAQMHQRRRYPEYVIDYVSPPLATGSGAHALWQRLLAQLYVQAGEKGGQRIHAGLPPEGEEQQIFRHMGFNAYAQEDVYQWAPASPVVPTAPIPLRRQRERDSWELQRLYALITPRPVQNAEGSAQAGWELVRRAWISTNQSTGYVWDGHGEIAAALQMRSSPRAHWLRMLLHPEMLEYADALVAAALSKVDAAPGQSVYCAVRTYEPAISSALLSNGFQPVGSQTLVVRHCTVTVRDTVGQMVRNLNGHPEHAAPTPIKYQSPRN